MSRLDATLEALLKHKEAIKNDTIHTVDLMKEAEKIERENRERSMFGQTIKEMKNLAIPTMDNPQFTLTYAMGILSDVQEHLEHGGDKETARQWINKAKYFISKIAKEM